MLGTAVSDSFFRYEALVGSEQGKNDERQVWEEGEPHGDGAWVCAWLH
jgi:hypothetical protein